MSVLFCITLQSFLKWILVHSSANESSIAIYLLQQFDVPVINRNVYGHLRICWLMDSRIQGFYWPLIGHRPVQAYFTYDTISPTWRTHDTGCFTFCSITVYMDNIRKPIHSFHHNRHYTDPKYSEGFSGVLTIKLHRDAWLSVGLS